MIRERRRLRNAPPSWGCGCEGTKALFIRCGMLSSTGTAGKRKTRSEIGGELAFVRRPRCAATEAFTATALFFPIPNPNRHPAPSLPTCYPAPSRHPSPTPPSTRASSPAALPGPLAPSLSDAAFNRSVLARGVRLCNLACLPISSGWFRREIEDRRRLIKVHCVVAFGAEQFPEKERKKTWSFFNWYYFALISILLLAVGVHVYAG
ncbi:putative nitrite transporter [Apostasia shenzhenica]|uniref:Putative nitrite transporter n=1 Tax=Apostasia shenzhenica TaxID=1088818 RepID=A0A2I0ARM4_9ASPA|nr:putative nitrite transporter [Apostasia shenzhenica]